MTGVVVLGQHQVQELAQVACLVPVLVLAERLALGQVPVWHPRHPMVVVQQRGQRRAQVLAWQRVVPLQAQR
jgi:hypothetical protein